MSLRADPGSPFTQVTGIGYRAMSPGDPLTGSRTPGRWGPSGILYLSASQEGVEAAMQAHGGLGGRRIAPLRIDARTIMDLRRPPVGLDTSPGACDWRAALAAGDEPPSWALARQIEAIGADGLIDPSRKAPGLWHLALFRWNRTGAPSVIAVD